VSFALVVRRLGVPREERFVLPVGSWLSAYGREFASRSLGGQLLLALVTVSILAALSTAVYAVAVPQFAQTYTDFYVVTEGDDGRYVASDYPRNLTENESTPVAIGVENHEQTRTSYEMVVTLDRFVRTGSGAKRVERRELGRYQATVVPGDRWVQPHRIRPQIAGQNLKIQYFLYRGTAPDDVGAETAYRHLHTWVDVTPAVGNRTTSPPTPDTGP